MADFRAQVETNFFGVVYVTKAVLPILRQQASGHLIQISSVGGRVGTAGLGAYQAAKWAVNGFTEVLAAEVGMLGVKVTALEPGGMQTDWAGSSMKVGPIQEAYAASVGAIAQFLTHYAPTPLGDPHKVAAVVLQIATMEQPPTRLLLGSDALIGARYVAQKQAESDAQWEALSHSTDRDDATEQDRNPLGIEG